MNTSFKISASAGLLTLMLGIRSVFTSNFQFYFTEQHAIFVITVSIALIILSIVERKIVPKYPLTILVAFCLGIFSAYITSNTTPISLQNALILSILVAYLGYYCTYSFIHTVPYIKAKVTSYDYCQCVNKRKPIN